MLTLASGSEGRLVAACQALVAASERKLVVQTSVVTVEVHFPTPLSGYEMLLLPVDQGRLALTTLAAGMKREDASQLVRALQAPSLEARCCDPQPPLGSWRLRELLRRTTRQKVPRGFVFTGSECLWLPPAAPDSVARLALRMFVSRLPTDLAIACYAGLLTDEAVAIAGDDCIRSIPEVSDALRQGTEAVAYRCSPPGITEVGRVVPGADKSGRAVEALGRLAAASVEHRERLNLEGQEIWVARTRSAASNLGAIEPLTSDSRWAPVCTGVDVRREQAEVTCVAEGIERYALGNVKRDRLRVIRASEVGGSFVDPRNVAAWDDRQREAHSLVAFDPNELEWCVQGQRCGTDENVWVPAGLVYCPFRTRMPWLHPGLQSSNGAAAHVDVDEAMRRAWLELVERDAFMRHWVGHHPPARLGSQAEGGLRGPSRSILAYLRRQGGDCAVFALRSSLDVPVMAAAYRSATCAFAIGAAARPEYRDAADKALRELLVLRSRVSPAAPLTPEDVRSPEHHGSLYGGSRAPADVRWWFEGPTTSECYDLESGMVDSLMHSAIGVRLARPGLYPFHVVRLVDPRLIPITFGFDAEPRARADLAELALESGVDPMDPLIPHPFA